MKDMINITLKFSRSTRWWKRVFFHLLDLSMVNAYILCNITNVPITQLQFRTSIASSLLEGHTQRVERRHFAPTTILPLRLSERPFPEKIPSTSASTGRPQCEVCRAQKKSHKQHSGAKYVRHLYILILA